jgi:hypothetical protein
MRKKRISGGRIIASSLTIALAINFTVSAPAQAQQRVEIAPTGVDWVDKLGAIVQTIINWGQDSVAENAKSVTPGTPTSAQESLTQVLHAMIGFSQRVENGASSLPATPTPPSRSTGP